MTYEDCSRRLGNCPPQQLLNCVLKDSQTIFCSLPWYHRYAISGACIVCEASLIPLLCEFNPATCVLGTTGLVGTIALAVLVC